MCSRLATEAGAHQSCFMVPGDEAAGRANALMEWVGSQCKTMAKLPHSSQPSEAGHCWQQDEELTFSFPAKMNSADFSKGRYQFYRLRAEAQVAEGAWLAVHHQPWASPSWPWCVYWATERSFACWAPDSVQHWGINTAIQTSFVCFLNSLTGSSAAVVWRVSFSKLLKRNVFLYCCMIERVIEAKQESVVSSGPDKTEKRRNVLEKITSYQYPWDRWSLFPSFPKTGWFHLN